MDAERITDVVPHADPEFVRLVSAARLAKEEERALGPILPAMHALFVRKREAFAGARWQEFFDAVDEEIRLIERTLAPA